MEQVSGLIPRFLLDELGSREEDGQRPPDSRVSEAENCAHAGTADAGTAVGAGDLNSPSRDMAESEFQTEQSRERGRSCGWGEGGGFKKAEALGEDEGFSRFDNLAPTQNSSEAGDFESIRDYIGIRDYTAGQDYTASLESAVNQLPGIPEQLPVPDYRGEQEFDAPHTAANRQGRAELRGPGELKNSTGLRGVTGRPQFGGLQIFSETESYSVPLGVESDFMDLDREETLPEGANESARHRSEPTVNSSSQFETVKPADRVQPSAIQTFETPGHYTEQFRAAWYEAKQRLAEKVDPGLFLAWLKPLAFIKVSCHGAVGGELVEVTLGAPNRFSTEHVIRRYSSLIIEQLAVAAGINPQDGRLTLKVGVGRGEPAGAGKQASQAVDFTAANSTQALTVKPLSRPGKSSAPVKAEAISRRDPDYIQANECGLNPKYNFSNFVVGGCNQFAHAVCLRVSEDLGGNYNPLFIYGGVGLGKTHLANAIGNASRRRGKRVLLVSSELFVSELIAALRSNKMQQFKNRFRSLDLLIVDDIQFIIGKERTQEEFFHTFNELHQKHKQIVMTSDKMPQDLIGLEERLKTRFASGISADLQAPDFETRVAILIRKSEQSSIELPVEVARLLAERIDTNVRELEGALNRIQAFSSLYQEPITVDLAQTVLKTVAPEKNREVSPEQIQRLVGERFSIGLSDIIGKRRTQNIALARQVAMFLCRRLTPSSYPEIGALFGGRDHSTVIHAYKVIEERMRTDEEFCRDIQAIERRLRS